MGFLARFLSLAGIAAFFATANPFIVNAHNAQLIRDFDYVIVGGGTSGLVVANRLSEDKSVTVLVVENGAIDDRPATRIPYFANINTQNLYNIRSGPEPFMHNGTWRVLAGNVVGGGTVVNGMFWDRGADADYEAWEQLGNPGWGYEGLARYFKKSTSFDGPAKSTREAFNITYDESAYGTGPVKVSYSSYQYEDYKPTIKAFAARDDIPYSIEGFSRPLGLFWVPNAIDNSTQERCHARKAYYDPVKARPNLLLLTNTHVEKILFTNNSSLAASGIRMKSNIDATTSFAFARKEVILAAGSIFTPHLLMLSGIGPKEVLKDANISLTKDLAAVGANFQDHPAFYMKFGITNQSIPNLDMLLTNPDLEFNATAAMLYAKNRTGPWTFTRENAVVFLPFKRFSKRFQYITGLIWKQNATQFLPSRYQKDSKLLKGFVRQREILIDHYLSDYAAIGEYPIEPWGGATTALQKPISRGLLTLNTTHPESPPIVVRHAFQNPVDKMVLGELVRWNREHWKSQYLEHFNPVEVIPGAQYTTDDEILDAGIRAAALNPTFAHSSGACAMMPEELGGCVDPQLRVYRVNRLRIVDANIIPLIPTTHLMATVYAVAEKAADIIKGS
ncbi:alcohol oxidase [Corynespora cassiicola Philippines]|uniref:Alcohol oxidase n=1 Tax=Corynespora cassiicola Philippines TaxID=1448308 RepID=A0A2T2N3B4_CORCC|nr:alcohol oxidase [Corynespora cassiicola Philippines]